MKKTKRIILTILAYLLFIGYIVGSIFVIKDVFTKLDDKLFDIISWSIIGITTFIIVYSIVIKIMNFYVKMGMFRKNQFNLNNDFLLDFSHLQRKIKIKTIYMFLFLSFASIMEILFPLAIGYLTKSQYSLIASAILGSYLQNTLVFKKKKYNYLSKKEFKKYYDLLSEVKNELNIKKEIYLIPIEGINSYFSSSDGHFTISFGIDLLYILNDEEIKAFFFHLCTPLCDKKFQAFYFYSKLYEIEDFISNRGLFPLESRISSEYFEILIIFMNYLKGDSESKPYEMSKSYDHYSSFLAAKYKKQLFKGIDDFMVPIDYLKIDNSNYYQSRLLIKKELIENNQWILDIGKKAINFKSEDEITYAEIIKRYGSEEFKYSLEINDSDELRKISKMLPLGNQVNAGNYMMKNFQAIASAKDLIEEEINLEELSFDDKLELALAYYTLKDSDRALNLALKLYEENNNSDVLNVLIGNIYIKGYNSYECENYLNRYFFKDEFKINAIMLLSNFYSRMGDEEKNNTLVDKYYEMRRLVAQNKIDKERVIYDKNDIHEINTNNQVYQEIIDYIKSQTSVKTLMMFEKFNSNSYKLMVITLGNIRSKEYQKQLEEIREYLQNRIDVNALVLSFSIKNKKIKNIYKDYVIYEKD